MTDCPFCLSNGLLQDAPLFKNAGFYVLAKLSPGRRDGVMIVPHRHVETPFDLTAKDWPYMAEALDFARHRLARFAPDGFSVGWNVGSAGGQHVMHAHLHVICRYEGQPATGLGLHGLIEKVNAHGKCAP